MSLYDAWWLEAVAAARAGDEHDNDVIEASAWLLTANMKLRCHVSGTAEEHSIGTTKHLKTISVLISVSYEVKSKNMKMFARNRGTWLMIVDIIIVVAGAS